MLQVKFRSFDYSKDLERLFEYMMKEDNQILFSHGFQIHNLPMFEGWISDKFKRSDYHDFFMIENFKGETIGYTFSYDFFRYDGHCKFTLCLYEEYQNKGFGAIAAIKMVDYLFRKYPLRQIFVSIFGYNKRSIDNNIKGGFEEVAILPDYRFCNGWYHSLHILTMSREKFYKKHEKILKKIN